MLTAIAGDIRVGRDVIVGTGDIVLIAVLLFIVASGICLGVWEIRARRHSEKLLRAAQEVRLAEGVTLAQGIRARFGNDGNWFEGEDSVCVLASGLNGESGNMTVFPATGQIEVHSFCRGPRSERRNEAGALIDAMIQAARETVTVTVPVEKGRGKRR